MYHKVDLESPTMWWVTVNQFYRQMHELLEKEVVYLDDYDSNNPKHVVITFDGIYQNVYQFAMPILFQFQYPFELFITGSLIGLDNKFDVTEPNTKFASLKSLQELMKNGGRLQWHTKTHPNLTKIKTSLLDAELFIPDDIKKLDSNGFKWFAYPYGEFNNSVKNCVKRKFEGALSCNQGSDFDKYSLNRITVTSRTKMNEQKLTCIVPCYNYGNFLIEALESILSQTILPDEIIIADDFSSDRTEIISRDYIQRFPDLIKYIRNNTNIGIVKNFNNALSNTNSGLIFFLGADNRIPSNYIEESVKIIKSSESIGIVYTDFILFGDRASLKFNDLNKVWSGERINNDSFKICFPEYEFLSDQITQVSKQNFIHGSSLFRKEAFLKVGGYIESEMAEDRNLFSRILIEGWIARKASNTFLEYRQHSEGQENNLLQLRNLLKFYERQNKALREEINQKYKFKKSLFMRLSFFLYRKLKWLKNYLKKIN